MAKQSASSSASGRHRAKSKTANEGVAPLHGSNRPGEAIGVQQSSRVPGHTPSALQHPLPRIPSDAGVRSRYRGCLLGGAVGDALGAPVEFLRDTEIRQRFGEAGIRDYVPAYGRLGAITDDTQMTLFTAEAMLRTYMRMVTRGTAPAFASVTAYAYQRWLVTQGCLTLNSIGEPGGWLIGHRELFHRRAPGNTCISALESVGVPGEGATNDSKGCGGVMRVAPVGMFWANWLRGLPVRGADEAPPGSRPSQPSDDEFAGFVGETFDTASEIAGLTHGHPTGQLPAGVFAVIIALVLVGTPLSEAVQRALVELRKRRQHEETLRALEHACELAVRQPGRRDVIEGLGSGWVAEEALAIALYCALSGLDFEAAVVLSVNHSGDSDSTGSIAGNLLGAAMGIEAIPSRWLEPLELRTVIEAMADDLATVREWAVDEEDATGESEFWWNRYPGG